MGQYWPKLIFIVGFLALAAVVLVICGIFKPIRNLFEVQGTLLAPEVAGPLWLQLRTICTTIGTNPPDQIIAGIDDNFFVTEQPVIVGGKAIRGRTLYVSLALLKQLDGQEADSVLAHEMAHFSGQDTMYSKRISPLLVRYGNYLEALGKGGVTLPIFYFMMCFRAFFELSLRRLGRRRETRADRIAVDTTSAQAFARAMLRIVAYSEYREKIQQGLFDQERALEKADIGRQVEYGFADFAATFASNPELGSEETPHPFDSHPPLSQRLATVNMALGSDTASAILGVPGDGHWYRSITGAEELERQQWDQFEAQFRAYHEQTLPYRFLPATDEERQIVLAAFPEVSFTGKKGTLTLDYDKMHYSSWPGPLRFAEIVKFLLNNSGVLTVQHKGSGKRGLEVKMKDFGNAKQQVLDAINKYYVRYQMAVNYQKKKMVKAQQCPKMVTE
jgi:Zn-dependent protease with chaperone function